jgi:hypothetical protein
MAAIALLSLAAGAAVAQDSAARTSMALVHGQQGAQVRINVAVNFFVPGPAGLDQQGLQAQERARRTIYRMAVHECAVLRETIAGDCRMEAVNVNANRHHGQQPDGFSVSANMTFRVTLK